MIQSGAGPTRNRALQAAKGDYIAFLDADDTWEKNYLAAVLPLAQNFGAAFGSTSVLERGAGNPATANRQCAINAFMR